MEDVSFLELAFRLFVSLGVVLALMVGAATVMRKRALPGLRGGGGKRRAAPIEILARQALGRNTSVAVVRAGEQMLVLGVTDTTVSLLTEADPDVFTAPTIGSGDGPEAQRTVLPGGGPRLGSTWMDVVNTLRERTVRRS